MWRWPRSLLLDRRGETRERANHPVQTPEQPDGLAPDGAREVHDLKDLPHETASNPEVQKPTPLSGGDRMWVEEAPRAQTTVNGLAGGAEASTKTVKIGAMFKRPGEPMRAGGAARIAALPPDPAENRSSEELSKWVAEHGLIPPEFRKSNQQASAAASRETLTRIIDWGTLTILCVAAGMAGVGLWSLLFR